MSGASHRPVQSPGLTHMLRQYGFVPEHTAEGAVYEVFEDFGSSWEALVVQASPQVIPVLISADCWATFMAWTWPRSALQAHHTAASVTPATLNQVEEAIYWMAF